MIVGIDGNQWYASNGVCLGDPRCCIVFADTCRQAIDGFFQKYPQETGYAATIGKFGFCIDMTVAEYKRLLPVSPSLPQEMRSAEEWPHELVRPSKKEMLSVTQRKNIETVERIQQNALASRDALVLPFKGLVDRILHTAVKFPEKPEESAVPTILLEELEREVAAARKQGF